MQKLRSVNTKFWDDPYIVTLKPKEKLLFLYLLTNPMTNILGIYEITLRRISYDTGLTEAEAEHILIENFWKNGKAFWMKNYIILPNFLKNQNLNPAMQVGALTIFNNLPEWLKDNILREPLTGYRSLRDAILNIKGIEVELESEVEAEAEADGSSSKNTQESTNDSPITPSMFDSFWKRYPRKTGKGKALTSWKTICKRKPNDRPTWDQISSAIRHQKKSIRWKDPEFIPYPATWLNQSRWLDDPETMVETDRSAKDRIRKGGAPKPPGFYDNVKSETIQL